MMEFPQIVYLTYDSPNLVIGFFIKVTQRISEINSKTTYRQV